MSTHTLHPRASAMLTGAGELVVASALDARHAGRRGEERRHRHRPRAAATSTVRRCDQAEGGDPPWRRARYGADGGCRRRRRAGGQRAGGQCAIGRRIRDVRCPGAALGASVWSTATCAPRAGSPAASTPIPPANSPARRSALSASAPIGQAVGHIAAHGFDLNVVATTRSMQPAPYRVGFLSIDALVEQSDIIVLCCPLTPETRGLISRERIARMKPRCAADQHVARAGDR